jgi:predicted transposase YdaD
MQWRMLEYMPRLASTYRLDLESVVLYIGRGAGADDTGLYEVHGFDGTPVLLWCYRVLRLWQMSAEASLVTPQVAPLALVGQMQLAQPEETLTAIVTRMRRVADVEQRRHLLTALVALLPEEEMVRMVERLLEDDELLLELPYMQRIREAGRAEGRLEGRREGEAEMLLRLLRLRFGSVPSEVTTRVTTADPETLLRWSERVLSSPTLEAVFAE